MQKWYVSFPVFVFFLFLFFNSLGYNFCRNCWNSADCWHFVSSLWKRWKIVRLWNCWEMLDYTGPVNYERFWKELYIANDRINVFSLLENVSLANGIVTRTFLSVCHLWTTISQKSVNVGLTIIFFFTGVSSKFQYVKVHRTTLKYSLYHLSSFTWIRQKIYVIIYAEFRLKWEILATRGLRRILIKINGCHESTSAKTSHVNTLMKVK